MCAPAALGIWALLLATGCPPAQRAESPVDLAAVGAVLDDWHQAAATADEARYFGHFTKNAIFIGTDAGERWTVERFRAYAHPHFAKGTGWTYRPRDRHINFGPAGQVAWIDEKLDNDKYGEARGTGIVVRVGSVWKLAHYTMSFPIPNAITGRVVALIRGLATAGGETGSETP